MPFPSSLGFLQRLDDPTSVERVRVFRDHILLNEPTPGCHQSPPQTVHLRRRFQWQQRLVPRRLRAGHNTQNDPQALAWRSLVFTVTKGADSAFAAGNCMFGANDTNPILRFHICPLCHPKIGNSLFSGSFFCRCGSSFSSVCGFLCFFFSALNSSFVRCTFFRVAAVFLFQNASGF